MEARADFVEKHLHLGCPGGTTQHLITGVGGGGFSFYLFFHVVLRSTAAAAAAAAVVVEVAVGRRQRARGEHVGVLLVAVVGGAEHVFGRRRLQRHLRQKKNLFETRTDQGKNKRTPDTEVLTSVETSRFVREL